MAIKCLSRSCKYRDPSSSSEPTLKKKKPGVVARSYNLSDVEIDRSLGLLPSQSSLLGNLQVHHKNKKKKKTEKIDGTWGYRLASIRMCTYIKEVSTLRFAFNGTIPWDASVGLCCTKCVVLELFENCSTQSDTFCVHRSAWRAKSQLS